MAAETGDIVYVCDPRWWLGGLHSVHLRADDTPGEDKIRLSPEAMARAHFAEGQEVIVEKIL